MIRKMLIVQLVLAIFLSFLGCSNASKPTSVQTSRRLKFGATYMTLNNPFFVELNEGIKDVVESREGKLMTLDPQLDVNKQIAQVKDLICQGADLIFLNPVDWKAIKPALVAAKDAEIPVIVVDAPVFDSELVESTVVSDNYNAGILCALDMIKRIGKKGNVAILEHPTAKSGVDRIRGFEETIKAYSDIKIVARETSDGQIEEAMPAMESILKVNPKIDGVMCLNDPTALGAIAALEKEKRLDGVLVYGVDGSRDAKKMIREGKLTATAAQFPDEIGRKAAEVAFKKLSGQSIEHEIKVPVELVVKSNIEKFK